MSTQQDAGAAPDAPAPTETPPSTDEEMRRKAALMSSQRKEFPLVTTPAAATPTLLTESSTAAANVQTHRTVSSLPAGDGAAASASYPLTPLPTVSSLEASAKSQVEVEQAMKTEESSAAAESCEVIDVDEGPVDISAAIALVKVPSMSQLAEVAKTILGSVNLNACNTALRKVSDDSADDSVMTNSNAAVAASAVSSVAAEKALEVKPAASASKTKTSTEDPPPPLAKRKPARKSSASSKPSKPKWNAKRAAVGAKKATADSLPGAVFERPILPVAAVGAVPESATSSHNASSFPSTPVKPNPFYTTTAAAVKSPTSWDCTIANEAMTAAEIAATKKTQIQYNPDVPMTKDQLTAWRREMRRVRNRESAAASRRKVRSRIEELEDEVEDWKQKHGEVIQRLRRLEDARGARRMAAVHQQQELHGDGIKKRPSTEGGGEASEEVAPVPQAGEKAECGKQDESKPAAN